MFSGKDRGRRKLGIFLHQFVEFGCLTCEVGKVRLRIGGGDHLVPRRWDGLEGFFLFSSPGPYGGFDAHLAWKMLITIGGRLFVW